MSLISREGIIKMREQQTFRKLSDSVTLKHTHSFTFARKAGFEVFKMAAVIIFKNIK
jgi:hypothetical protein